MLYLALGKVTGVVAFRKTLVYHPISHHFQTRLIFLLHILKFKLTTVSNRRLLPMVYLTLTPTDNLVDVVGAQHVLTC